MRYRLPKTVADEVIRRFDADTDITVGEIARDMQVTRSWAATILRDAGRDPDSRWRRLTAARLAEAWRRTDAGETTVAVANDLGLHANTLRRALRNAGRPTQVCPPPMDAEEAVAVRDLYATGHYTKAALGRLFGRGHSAIRTALAGGPKPKELHSGRLTPQCKAEVTRLYVAGVPIPRICHQLGVGETSVHRHIRTSGLTQRRPRDAA